MKRKFLKTDWPVWALLAIISLFIIQFIYFSFQKPIYQDEGVFLAIGKGMALGRLPYRDFWDHKPPGIYLMFGGLYRFFGSDLIFYKIAIWLVNSITAAIIFLIIYLLDRKKIIVGLLAAAIYLLALIFFEGNYLIAEPVVSLFLVTSFLFTRLRSKKNALIIFSGFLGAVAVIFKQTALISAFLIWLFQTREGGKKKSFLWAVGFLIPVIGVVICVWARGLGVPAWEQIVSANFGHYPAEPLSNVLIAWGENLRRTWWLWLGVILYFFTKSKPKDWQLILLFMIPIPFFLVRQYPHYWIQVLPFASILCAEGYYLFVKERGEQRYAGPVIFLFLAVLSFSLVFNLLWYRWVASEKNLPKQQEQTEVSKDFSSNKSQYILAENRFTGFYFIFQKEPLTRYLYITEVNESEAARTKTIEGLNSGKSILVFWPSDNQYVYAKEIRNILDRDFQAIKTYPELGLTVWTKN